MKRILKLFVSIMLFGSMMLTNASAIRVLHIDRTDNVVFRDSLQSGDMSDWEVFIPAEHEWTLADVSDGKALKCTYDAKWNYSVISPNIDNMKDFMLSADFTFTARTERSGVMFRAVDAENNYVVWLGREKDVGLIGLNKQLGQGQWQGVTVVQKNANIPKNKAVNLVVRAEGNKIIVSLDGMELINYNDEDSPILEGKVGFLHYYGETEMRNFSLINLSEKDDETEENKYNLKQYTHYDEEEIKEFSDAIFDYYGWESYSNGNLFYENDNLIILSSKDNDIRESAVSYVRKKTSSLPIEFAAKGEGEEYAISFANCEKYQLSGLTDDGYLLRVKKNELILEKWAKGDCLELAKVDGTFMAKDDYKEFKITTGVEDEGFCVNVFVDCENVIKTHDVENPIVSDGYVSVISYLEELKIKASKEKELTEKQILGNVICGKVGSNKIYIGGFQNGIEIYKKQTLMLPLRMLASGWGAEISWDEKNKCAEILYKGNKYNVMDGYSDYFKNDESINVNGVIENKNGIMYVPCDFFEKEFDKKLHITDSGIVFIFDKAIDCLSILENDEALEKLNNKLQ